MEAIRIVIGFLRIGRLQNLFQELLRLLPQHRHASSSDSPAPPPEPSVEMGPKQLFLNTYPMRLTRGLDNPNSDFYASIPERSFRYYRKTQLQYASVLTGMRCQNNEFSQSTQKQWL